MGDLNNKEFSYKNNIESQNRMENRKLHTMPQIFRSDMNIEDYYRLLFSQRFTNNITKLRKSFFDIEVDGRYAAGDFVQMGECPINAISFHDEYHDITHQYLLRNSDNPLIADYENRIKSGKFGYKHIRDFIIKAVGGIKQFKRYKLENTKFDIEFFDNEIELLQAFFNKVHEYDPDFTEGWNGSAFDLSYIIARIENLGYTPADIMADQSWEVKVVKNYVDQRNLSMLAERGDYTFISGDTVWIDQMIQYASRRKSKIGSFKSFKLDDIGEMTAGVKKLDYSKITNDITMLPWLNYEIFSLYNIMDTIVQKCIEIKTQDLEYIFAKCIVNNTVYRKGHRQTVYLINRMAKEFDSLGYIIGNNVNKWNEEPDKFLGALVGDPTHTNEYAKVKVNGVPTMVCDNLQDNDYKSLYPSIIEENNIAPNTQVGRIDIPNKVYENENAYMNDKYSRGGEFIENMVTDNIIEFGKRWFHLAGFNEMLKDIEEYNKINFTSYSSNGSYGQFYYYNEKMVECPIYDAKRGDMIKDVRKPVFFYNNLYNGRTIYEQPNE
jgi:DNA polymerase elongation subunit (family B)